MVEQRSILVVEDEPHWQAILKRILEQKHYHVETAKNYSEAIEQLQQKDFHLAIVDLRLNEIDENNRDGIALLRNVFNRDIPAIIVTGYATPTLIERARKEYGEFSLIEKSNFDKEEFGLIVGESIKPTTEFHFVARKSAEQMRELRRLTRRLFQGKTITFR